MKTGYSCSLFPYAILVTKPVKINDNKDMSLTNLLSIKPVRRWISNLCWITADKVRSTLSNPIFHWKLDNKEKNIKLKINGILMRLFNAMKTLSLFIGRQGGMKLNQIVTRIA